MSKSSNCEDLNLPVSPLYLLAAPSTPEEVRTEVLDRAAKGEKVTHKEVKEAIGRARSAKVSTTKSAATVQPEQPEGKDVRDEAPLSPAPPTGRDDGLILLGCLRAFDRQGLLGHDPGAIVRGMPVDVAKDVHMLAPTVASWLNRIKGPAPPIGADEPQFPRRSEPGTMLKKT